MNLYKKSREREMISMYYDDAKKKEYNNQIQEHIIGGKSHMQPIKNFTKKNMMSVLSSKIKLA